MVSKVEEIEQWIEGRINELKELRKKNVSEEQVQELKQQIWEFSKDRFKLSIEEKIKKDEVKQYKGIIFSVGFSKEPIILNILGFQPEYCFFIHSSESERILDIIIEETGLRPSNYKRETLKKNSAADSYNAVKKGLKYLMFEKGLKEQEIALDPTGGTKAMSVGCGIATNSYNIDLLYVDNTDYDTELRRPRPGSERIVNVVNPFRIYYDDVILEGLDMLQIFSFEAARKYFIDAEKNGSDPLIPKILLKVAIGLHLWDLFEHKKAYKNLSEVLEYINQYQKLHSIKPIIENWLQYLRIISQSDDIIEEETLDVYFNGNRMRAREQFDNAAMRYYRAIEMNTQYILKRKYNLDTQNPDYTYLNSEFLDKMCKQSGKDKSQVLLEQYNAIWEKIFEKKGEKKKFKMNTLLPLKIGLINGLIMRLILKDPALDFTFLFKIFNAVETRNNSILAHGVKPITKKDCDVLKGICEQLLKSILEEKKDIKENIFNKNQLKLIHDIVRKEL
ncbi:MAG: TIGR02710 family CRISPR-associated CARF protein [Candidatus Helarchaeota archaeon]